MIAVAIAIAAAAAPAVAQPTGSYPDKAVKIIVPASPGRPSDMMARLLADYLGTALGQPFVTDNRPGAANTLGTAAVAARRPDGYTLLETPNQWSTGCRRKPRRCSSGRSSHRA